MYTFTLPNTQFTGGNTIANILAGTSPFQQQGFSTVGSFSPTIRNFGTVTYIDPNLKNPQYQQYQLHHRARTVESLAVPR